MAAVLVDDLARDPENHDTPRNAGGKGSTDALHIRHS
jgi:hypothetical protein